MANIRKQPVLRMSDIYAPTLKEDPSDADIESAKLLVRAGMIRKEAAGLYTFLEMARDAGELAHVPELRFVREEVAA